MSFWAKELNVSLGTPGTWPSRVFDEKAIESVARLADELMGAAAAPTVTRLSGNPGSAWEGGPRDWPNGTADGRELRRRAQLSGWRHDGVPSSVHSDDQEAALDHEATWSIRRAIIDELRRGYLDAHADPVVMALDHHVIRLWEDLDHVLVPNTSLAMEAVTSPLENPRHRGPQSMTLRAIVQMHAHLVTDNQPTHRERLRDAGEDRRFALGFVSAQQAALRRSRHGERAERLFRAIGPAAPTELVEVDGDLKLLMLPDPLRPDDALRITNKLRLLNVGERRFYLPYYVTKRQEIPRGWDELRSRTPRSLELFGLADQAADLIMLDSGADELRNQMATIIHGNPAHRYDLFPDRNDALALGKRSRYTTASARIAFIYRSAEERADLGELGDAQEALETLHQVCLAATGILTGSVELQLTTRRLHPGPVLAHHTDALLNWRDLLESHLISLEDRIGLPPQRHEDGTHIYWKDWAVTTAQNAARASIVATTALDAFALTHLSDRDGSLNAAKERYLRLIKLPELRASHEGSLVMPATWLAMLNKNMIPTILVAPTDSLAGMTLLVDADRRERAAGSDGTGLPTDAEIDFRHEASARWHVAKDDGGRLATLVRNGVSWTHLNSSSNGAFRDWYDLVDEAGLVPARARSTR